MIRLLLISLLFLLSFATNAQSDWKLMKDRNGIKVYMREAENSKYKSIRVTCTLEGTYDKLIAILTNVEHQPDWVYRAKATKLLKKNSPTDLMYYTETSMPWPMDNRDAVVHLRINRDNLPQSLSVSAKSEPNYLKTVNGLVRIPFSEANWQVTMNNANTLNVDYTLQVNPGGQLPAWLVNTFADKGPYESFKKLAELLKR